MKSGISSLQSPAMPDTELGGSLASLTRPPPGFSQPVKLGTSAQSLQVSSSKLLIPTLGGSSSAAPSGFGLGGLSLQGLAGGSGCDQPSGGLSLSSLASSHLASPIAAILVARFDSRLPATIGGILASLGWLFASFSVQTHQVSFTSPQMVVHYIILIFIWIISQSLSKVSISFGLFLGPGLALLNAGCSGILGKYFRKRRSLVESLFSSSVGFSV